MTDHPSTHWPRALPAKFQFAWFLAKTEKFFEML